MRLVIGPSAGDHVRVACLELKAAPRAVRHPRRHVRQRQCNGVRLIGRLQRIASLSRGRIVNDGVRLVGNLRSSARAALDSIKEHVLADNRKTITVFFIVPKVICERRKEIRIRNKDDL